MKTSMFFVVLLGAVLASSVGASFATAANTGSKERALITFAKPVELLGVKLKGEYLFVHDEQRMARGESCTFVYNGNSEIPEKLVLSFHCIPFPNIKASHFTVRTVPVSSGLSELREFQFAGSSELHRVPANEQMAHVNLVP